MCSISYMHVAHVEGVVSIGVFLFKRGSALRLHNHPDMSVYTRYAPSHVCEPRLRAYTVEPCASPAW